MIGHFGVGSAGFGSKKCSKHLGLAMLEMLGGKTEHTELLTSLHLHIRGRIKPFDHSTFWSSYLLHCRENISVDPSRRGRWVRRRLRETMPPQLHISPAKSMPTTVTAASVHYATPAGNTSVYNFDSLPVKSSRKRDGGGVKKNALVEGRS